ncbi:MAG TPA: hypothetical protein VED41_13040 [Solirubrobacteraceae bacterium]|nr:hypothetical protein [Solirubrobacteraceae bacterium]
MDNAAAPIQPIVEGLVTYPGGPGTTPQFDGKGVSAIVRDPAALNGKGAFILTLDVGLPGNAGAVPFGPSPPLLPDPDVRTLVLPIGGTGIPPLSGIASIGVSYIPSAQTGVGAPQIEAVFTNAAFVTEDPKGGFQIIVWRGLGGGVVV